MSFNLAGKRAIVSGGGVGIGKSIVDQMCGEGMRVALTYLSHAPDQDFLDACRAQSGHEVITARVDATDERQVVDFVARVNSEFGGLDVLVNNVGGLVDRVAIADMELDLWHKVQAVNLDSMFLMSREALKFMAEGGRIINVASLAGHNGGANGATAYATSKSAVFGFTRGLAKEVAERSITVNALAPGLILDTPFHETFTAPDAQKAAVQGIALKRPGMPTDVAGPTLWLASEHASFVTGSVVDINGGQYFA